MAEVKFVHSPSGYISLMKSGAMRGVLEEHAARIKSEADDALSDDKGKPLNDPPYVKGSFETSERAGVRVTAANDHSIYAEAKHHILQNAAGV